MIELGIITYQPNGDGIRWVKSLGLNNAEFCLNGDEIYSLNAEDVISACKETGVKVASVGRWGRFRINEDGSINEKEQKDEFLLIDFCRKIGCPVYVTGCNYVDGLSYYTNVTATINYFKSLMDYAGDDVKICTYNCNWNAYTNKPHEWDIIHDHLPKLGIKFDPSHTIIGGRNWQDEAVKYGSRFYHMHVKGTVDIGGGRFDDPPAGMDSINWGLLVAIMRKHGYNGVMSIEPHSETWQGELGAKGIAFTIKMMKQLLFIED